MAKCILRSRPNAREWPRAGGGVPDALGLHPINLSHCDHRDADDARISTLIFEGHERGVSCVPYDVGNTGWATQSRSGTIRSKRESRRCRPTLPTSSGYVDVHLDTQKPCEFYLALNANM